MSQKIDHCPLMEDEDIEGKNLPRQARLYVQNIHIDDGTGRWPETRIETKTK